MSARWHQFLSLRGGRFDGPTLVDFGAPASERKAAVEGAIVTPLTGVAAVEVSGGDAQSFLSRQLTNDFSLLGESRGTLSAWCNIKGRVISVFWLMRAPQGGFLLLLPADLASPVCERLGRYILRSDVKLTLDPERLVVGLSGAGAGPCLAGRPLELPQTLGAVAHTADLGVIRIPGTHPRHIVFGTFVALEELWPSLEQQLTPAGAHAWRLLDILSGVPFFEARTSEAFLPQMLNLEALGALSFSKGCYPGQEIIARTRYRGELKRRLYLAQASTHPVPEAGAKIYVAGSSGSCGEVVSAAARDDETVVMLAVIVIEHAQSNNLVVSHSEKVTLPIRILPLPG